MKKTFDSWRRCSINAKVEYNLPERVVIYLSWAIAPKKNSRQNFGRVSLPSKNYIEWHKRVVDKLKDVEWRFKNIPCVVNITSVVWDKVMFLLGNAQWAIYRKRTKNVSCTRRSEMIFGYFFTGEGIKYFLEKVDKIQQKLTYEPTGCIIQNYRVTILEKKRRIGYSWKFLP